MNEILEKFSAELKLSLQEKSISNSLFTSLQGCIDSYRSHFITLSEKRKVRVNQSLLMNIGAAIEEANRLLNDVRSDSKSIFASLKLSMPGSKLWQLEAMISTLLGFTSQLFDESKAETQSKRKSEQSIEQLEASFYLKKLQKTVEQKNMLEGGGSHLKYSSPEVFGTFSKDTPIGISGHSMFDGTPTNITEMRKVFFKVIWKAREDMSTPEPTFYSYDALKRQCPNLLLSYFESVVELDADSNGECC